MKVRMLLDHSGSPDGVGIVNYLKGETYDIPDRLATVFLEQKWAEKHVHKVEPKPVAVKAEVVPENKMMETPENKTEIVAEVFETKKRKR